MGTIALSEAEIHELRSAAWGAWQRDDIGDEPSAAELREHVDRMDEVIATLSAAAAEACEPTPALLRHVGAYEEELARDLLVVSPLDRPNRQAALEVVRNLAARLRDAPPSALLRCACCGVASETLSAKDHCPSCEERGLLQDQYAAQVIEALMQRLMHVAVEYVAASDVETFASDAVARACAERAGLTAPELMSNVRTRLRVLADQRKALEVA